MNCSPVLRARLQLFEERALPPVLLAYQVAAVPSHVTMGWGVRAAQNWLMPITQPQTSIRLSLS
jgi:hypothetical protein